MGQKKQNNRSTHNETINSSKNNIVKKELQNSHFVSINPRDYPPSKDDNKVIDKPIS